MERHRGPILPETGGRKFAYEDERVTYPVTVIVAWPNDRRGVKEQTPEEQLERKRYDGYELWIKRGTGTSLNVTLRKRRRDIGAQRKTGGKVVTHDVYERTIAFAELANLLFSESNHFEEEEHYPACIHQAMKTAYTT